MTYRKLGLLSALVAVIVAVFVSTTGASASSQPQQIQDAQMQVLTTTFGGASVLPTTRTVQHWWGSTLDPHNGITYGYNMVGADPNTCAGSACSATVTGDIIPLNVVVGDRTFDGQAVVGPTLDSPVFATNDYGSTPFATAGAPNLPRGPGGVLSQDDAGNLLQVEDATMRAQFNQTGSSSYHLNLTPVVHDPITIVVPSGKGTLLQSGRERIGSTIYAPLDGQMVAASVVEPIFYDKENARRDS